MSSFDPFALSPSSRRDSLRDDEPSDWTPRLPPGPRPADFALRYAWREGSLPPPHHYSVRFHIDADGSGEVTMTQGYGSEGVAWTEPLSLSSSELDALWDGLVEAGLLDGWRSPGGPPRIGGSSWDLDVTARDHALSIPRYAESASGVPRAALENAARTAVPDALWADLHARRQAAIGDRR